jgi:hypothetical protein
LTTKQKLLHYFFGNGGTAMMTLQQAKIGWLNLILAGLITCAACKSDDGGGNNPQPTATPAPPTATSTTGTATPTTLVGAGVVRGLVVLRDGVPSGAEDAVGLPPTDWTTSPDGEGFDRALSFADWVLEGPQGRSGTTADDGRFEIRDLPAGRYDLTVTKTLAGNLATITVPLVVGTDGNATVVIEVDRGLVRSNSTYRDGDVIVHEVTGPGTERVVDRSGRIVEIESRASSGRSRWRRHV